MDLSWRIEEDRELDAAESPRPLLSTWRHLRNALRRQWRTIAALSGLGLLLGLALVAVQPPGSTATVTLLMAHPTTTDAQQGSAMDVGLLNMRTVSDRTVRALALDMTPEAFRSAVTFEAVTPEILTMTVAGPDDVSAVARGRELVRQYLAFRASTLTGLSSGLRSEYSAKIASAQEQVTSLSKQFESLSAQGSQGANQAFDVLARRSDLNTKIAGWQETMDAATLQTDAALKSTRVIDAVHPEKSSVKRAAVLAGASGLIAGGALAVGLVLFRALVSERLRRRQDIAIALSAPVRFSVCSPGPPDRRAGLRRLLPPATPWRRDDLATLAHGLERAVDVGAGMSAAVAQHQSVGVGPGTPGAGQAAAVPVNGRNHESLAVATPGAGRHLRGQGSAVEQLHLHNGLLASEVVPVDAGAPSCAVALAAVGNPRAGADVLVATAERLRERGLSVVLVDLSKQGYLSGRGGDPGSEVWRPDGIPELARGPRGAVAGAPVDLPGDDWRDLWQHADVLLALVEVNPGIEVQPLATWVDEVVPLVAAGAATAELLNTTGNLVREAGLALPFVMMVGCDATDKSLGMIELPPPVVPTANRDAVGSAG